jgi:hypothetical protein
MGKQNYTTSFLVDNRRKTCSPVNNARGWWSGEIDGRTGTLGAEFTHRYQDLHRSRQSITEFVPGKKIVWHVQDAKIDFVKDKDEWNGTDIVFDIAKKGSKTELRFTHIGLVPAIECYGKCAGAWGFYINESLRSLITTGEGDLTTRKVEHDRPRQEVRRQEDAMSESYLTDPAGTATHFPGMPVIRIARWLHLAAAPTFAMMAPLTSVFGQQTDMFCSAMHDTSPLAGMAAMYLLMSAFHLPPWLKLMFGRRR